MKSISKLVRSAKAALALAGLLSLFAPFAQADEASDVQSPSSPAVGDPLPTEPGDFSVKTELGFAIPLSAPQSQLFNVGGSESIKAFWALSRYFDIGPSAMYLGLPTQADTSVTAAAWAFGASLQLKRPHDMPGNAFQAMSPWVDVDALFVDTGPLDRAGFAVAAGLAFPITHSRVFWLGPFVRYFMIYQANDTGFNDSPANTLSIGLSLDVGAPVRRQPEAASVAVAAPAPAPEIQIVTKDVCPDRDGDGVPDMVDLCPDVPGPMESYGCPVYKKIVVHKDRLELKEKIQFAWDQATLLDVSFPLLDEVVQALKDNKGFRVQVNGNTSSEGTEEHNQTLSTGRAQAVLDYLVAHGISKDRLDAEGFASTIPVATNKTEVGREANRRVEFAIHFKILNPDGSK